MIILLLLAVSNAVVALLNLMLGNWAVAAINVFAAGFCLRVYFKTKDY